MRIRLRSFETLITIIMLLGAIAIGFVIISGPPDAALVESGDLTNISKNSWRVIDREAGIVCWVVQTGRYAGDGVDCLPLSQTNPGQ